MEKKKCSDIKVIYKDQSVFHIRKVLGVLQDLYHPFPILYMALMIGNSRFENVVQSSSLQKVLREDSHFFGVNKIIIKPQVSQVCYGVDAFLFFFQR